MITKVVVAALVVAVVVYMAIVGYRGVQLIASGNPVGIVLGSSVLVLPATGCYVLWRELVFGSRSADLAEELEAQGQWPTEILPTRPSGRPRRDAADEVFHLRRLEVERTPDDWRAWYRLGLAYENSGDRRRARRSIRHAIRLHDDESASPPTVTTPAYRPLPPGKLDHPDQRGRDGGGDHDDEEGRAEQQRDNGDTDAEHPRVDRQTPPGREGLDGDEGRE